MKIRRVKYKKERQWKTAYLPVWLYIVIKKKEEKVVSYIMFAVNARTKKSMGSVPLHLPKLLGISFLVEILGILLMLWVEFDYSWLFY